MLTQDDLQQITKIIDQSVGNVAQKVVGLGETVVQLGEKIDDLGDKVQTLETKINVLGIRVDKLESTTYTLGNRINRYHKELLRKTNDVLNFIEEGDLKIKVRVQRIEEHLQLPEV